MNRWDILMVTTIVLALVGLGFWVADCLESIHVFAQAPTQVDSSRQVRTANLSVTRVDDHTLMIGKNCSLATPCNVRFGSQVFSFISPATVSVTSGTGALNVWVNPSGQIVVGASGGVTCAGCSMVVSATAFPVDGSIPISTWSYLNGTLAATQSDWLTSYSSTPIQQGFGIMLVQHGQYTEIAVDATQFLWRAPVPASSSDSCSAGSFAMGGGFFYLCVAPNTWQRSPVSTW